MNTARFTKSTGRITRSSVLFCALAGVACIALPNAVMAQTQRVLEGKVVDKGDASLKGAVVYLKDGHTMSVKSYISGDDGSYRFGQLAQSTDYSVWAESAGKKSPVKNISSFDTKAALNITLKIDTSK